MVFTAAPHRFSSHALSRPHSNGPTPPVRRVQAAASMVVPLLTKHPAWDGASPCPATMETMEIEAWQTWEDFTGVFAIHQEKQAWNTVIQHDSTMT